MAERMRPQGKATFHHDMPTLDPKRPRRPLMLVFAADPEAFGRFREQKRIRGEAAVYVNGPALLTLHLELDHPVRFFYFENYRDHPKWTEIDRILASWGVDRPDHE